MKARWLIVMGVLAFATGAGAGWGWKAISLIRQVVGEVVPRPTTGGIVIHHTATPAVLNGKLVDVAVIDDMHRRRGFSPVEDAEGKRWYIGYHYLIQQNGVVQQGRPEDQPGSHTRGHPDTIGIVLVGNFHSTSNRFGRYGVTRPPRAQMQAAIALTREVMARRHVGADKVFLHRDLTPTACPGDNFPRAEFYRALQ